MFSEHVEAARLREPQLLRVLAERRVQLVVAVRPNSVTDGIGVVAAARAAGVGIAVWPMIDDADGRWASAANAEAFATFVDAMLAELARHDAVPDELCVDLEPPIALVRAWSTVRPARTIVAGDRIAARDRFATMLAHAQSLGIVPWAAVIPLVLADPRGAAVTEAGLWQQVLGTPVDALAFARVCPMLYSSMVGYARGLLRRDHGEAFVWLGASACARRYGPRASVGLGAVGPGALGDEPTYVDEGELARDVALARAAGVDDLALFDLGGALARPPLERWLDAFCDTPPASEPPRLGKRVRGLAAIVRALARWRRA